MNNDTLLVLGIVLCVLAIPSIINAFSSSTPPRVASVVLVAGAGFMAWAIIQTPGGYSFEEIPGVFTRVVADIIR